MTHSFDPPEVLGCFSGTAPLFPLPNLVLFPHVLQPLHIFEPRYREMVADALEGEKLIGMALLQPGWEVADDDRPGIFPVVCLGRIVAHEQLESGKFNLLLQGVQRARIVEEVQPHRAYRSARLTLLPDVAPELASETEQARRAELLEGFRRLFPRIVGQDELHRTLNSDVSLSVLCDVVTHALQLDPVEAQTLLAEFDVDRRCKKLLAKVRELTAAEPPARKTFPPEFSLN